MTEHAGSSPSSLAKGGQVEPFSRSENSFDSQAGPVDIVGLLTTFLERPGHVLLVQGSPGSGKTSLALEVLRKMEQSHKLYASTRVSPQKLRQHFPWIDQVIDSMTGRMSKGTWIDELHDLRRAEPDSIHNQILRLKRSKRKALLVIDSWEGALRNSNEDGRRMMESSIFSELDESGVSVLIVNEGRVGGLDYLVDGIVTLGQLEIDGRKLRMLEVNKLRGFRVSTPRILFSLDKARFTQLPLLPVETERAMPKILIPVPHSKNFFSSGCEDLDRVIGGGFQKGAFVLLELEKHVPPLVLRVLLNTIRGNFVKQGGAAFIVPTGTYSSESVADSLRPLIGDEALEERVRIAEYNPTVLEKRWRVMMRGDLLGDSGAFQKAWNGLAKSGPDLMLNVDLDKMVQVYGNDVALPGFAGVGEGLRDLGALYLVVASRDTKVKEEFLRTADYHLKINIVEGFFLICGVKPYTPLYGVHLGPEKGYTPLSLVEAV